MYLQNQSEYPSQVGPGNVLHLRQLTGGLLYNTTTRSMEEVVSIIFMTITCMWST